MQKLTHVPLAIAVVLVIFTDTDGSCVSIAMPITRVCDSVKGKKVKAEHLYSGLTPEALRYGSRSFYPAKSPYPRFTS